MKVSDGSPFFWIGDTGWGLSNMINHADIELYLNNRQAKGFTVIQMTAQFFRSPEASGQGAAEDNPRNTAGHRMFNGSAQDPTTSSPKTDGSRNPDNPNDYWDTIDFIVRETKERGMHLVLLPTWGSKFVNVSSPATPEFTEAEARAYGQWIGDRYKNEPHIIWCMGGDTTPSAGDYGNKHAVYRAMAEGVVKGVTGVTLTYNQSDAAALAVWERVLMTYHPPSRTSSSNWFHNDTWLDFNMTQSGQRHPDEGADKVISDYGKTPIKPTLNAEACYEGFIPWDPDFPERTPLTVRRTLYQSMFAGGFGYTYGASVSGVNPDQQDALWGFGYGIGSSSWKDRLDLPGAGDMTVAKNLLTARAWHTFAPSQGVITSGAGSGATRKHATKSTVENEILVYFASNSSAGINNTLNTSATATWFDPRNGNTQNPNVTFTAGQTRTIQPPSGWEDAVLILTGTGGGGSQTPYGSTPASIPGTLQAENFDNGGEGVAYHDTTSGNSGNASYRSGTNVDISSNSDGGSGYHVSYPAVGEWLEYTVNVTATGTYNLNVRAASLNGGGQMQVKMDGANIGGTINIPQTGGWNVWQTTTVNGISLTAGQRIVQIYYVSPGFNLNWISFVSSGGGGSTVVIVDNTDTALVTVTGSWTASTATAGYHGTNYRHDGNAGKGSKSLRFRPNLPSAGNYEVFMKWTSYSNRADNVPVDIFYSGGSDAVQVNQQADGGTWVSLGTYPFAAGTAGSVLISNTGTNGYVVADAVKFEKQ